MDSTLLKTFIAVADWGSLNKGAEKLFLSPVAVMKQINQLEKTLNLKLIERSNRGVTLTPAGESIYKDSKFILDYWEKATAQAKEIAGRDNEIIRVGTSLLNPCKPFMDIWYRLSDIFPGFKIQIIPFEDDHRGILSVIEKIGRDFDFIVGVCNSASWLERCNICYLGFYKKCLAVPADHRLAGRKKVKVEDLHGETLMMVKRGDSQNNDELRDFLEENHREIKIEDTDYYYDIGVFNRCEQTGNVLLNLECWQDIHPSLVTVEVDWDYAIPYGLLYPLNPKKEIQHFIEAVKATLP